MLGFTPSIAIARQDAVNLNTLAGTGSGERDHFREMPIVSSSER